MALTHLLDTSVFSQPIRDTPNPYVMDRWSALPDVSLGISSIVHAEILQGLKDRDSKKYWRRYRELLKGRHQILSFDETVAEHYSDLLIEQKRAGKPKPMADLMIAATARSYGLIVATLNIKDFIGIPGLSVENWGA
jgi:tRNA(fMet)-specific endonuclease VapC